MTMKIATSRPADARHPGNFFRPKSNVDQIMSSLQDGLMLFTRDSRVVLVSARD